MKTRPTSKDRLAGWPLVGWCSLVLIAITLGVLAGFGAGERGLHLAIRTSAQTSLLLFTSAFVASSVAKLWPTDTTRWMLRNRRYLGVSFAVSHLIHLLAILALLSVSATARAQQNAATIVGGGIAYLFIAAMAATSFDRSAAWIGPRAWRILHTTGAYSIWFIFFISYVPRAAQSAPYVLPAAVVVAAAGVRALARVRSRQRVVRPAAPSTG